MFGVLDAQTGVTTLTVNGLPLAQGIVSAPETLPGSWVPTPEPQIPPECHNSRKVDAEVAMEAVRAMCQGVK